MDLEIEELRILIRDYDNQIQEKQKELLNVQNERQKFIVEFEIETLLRKQNSCVLELEELSYY